MGGDPHRLRFAELPPGIVRRIETELGSSVVGADDRQGGYSPSVAAACALGDGRTVFIKAVSPDQNPDSPDFLRREAQVCVALPAEAPAPRLLAVIDDGSWVVLVHEFVPGRLPHIPWERDELARVMAAARSLEEIVPPAGLPPIADRYGPLFDGWRCLAAAPPPDGVLDGWTRRHLERLADLEPDWAEAVAGEQLVHGDLRSDNVLLDGDRVVFVDWPAACVGRTWFDVVCMLPSVALEGGGKPAELIGLFADMERDGEAITALIVAATGYFLDRARQPDPPGLPTVRKFQRQQGEVCLDWLKDLLGWS